MLLLCNHVLSTPVAGKLWALEQDLKRLPYIRGRGVSAVDNVGSVGETGGDRLIDINHCVATVNNPGRDHLDREDELLLILLKLRR
jgi:hypothetical protein